MTDMTPELRLQCEDGHNISSIEFASYGTPQGSCQKFSRGKCHSSNSYALVSEVCGIFFYIYDLSLNMEFQVYGLEKIDHIFFHLNYLVVTWVLHFISKYLCQML